MNMALFVSEICRERIFHFARLGCDYTRLFFRRVWRELAV